MGNLLGSLLGAAGAMSVYQQALAVSENNITNSSTPGYAKQRLDFRAKSFVPESGLPGGVDAGNRQSTRDPFLEQSVRIQNSLYSFSSQTTSSLQQLEPILTVADGAGIPDALNKLFQSFSALSVSPNDVSARQSVLDAASGFVQQMNEAASQLGTAASNISQQAAASVSQINDLVSQIQSLNVSLRQSGGNAPDAGVDAQMNSALEQLSAVADISVLNQPDGSVSVYLGGLTPLVMGDTAFPLTADPQSGQMTVRDYQGQDITANIRGGSLGALLDTSNTQIPSYINGLNRLAAGVADAVNGVLAGGLDQNGQPPAQNLFNYNSSADAASTLTVNPLTPDQIAAASAASPGGNGNALALADLGSSPQLDGLTFSGFYGSVAAGLGRDLSTAQNNADTQQLLLDQARTLRSQTSGVDLNEEAAKVMELQRGYQACGQLVSVLNSLADTVLQMVQ